MNLGTLGRVATAMQTPDGRARYRSALRSRIWTWLGKLPWELRINSKLDGRLPIRLSARDQVISRSIFATGAWEPLEASIIRRFAKPGMTVVDIGANLGAHTLMLADCVGPEGRVHAFEPTRVFELLEYNIRQNGFAERVRLNRCAMGASEGTLRLMACKPGLELFTSRSTPLVAEVATGDFVEFPMTTLDRYAEQNGISCVDFLKLDVEGSEDIVLEGCQKLFAKNAIRCMLLELNDVCLARSGSSTSRLLALVHAAGFEVQMLDDDGGFSPLGEDLAGKAFNVIATRKGGPPELLLHGPEHARM